MIKKIIFFFFLLNFFNNSSASIENKIINNFKKINNISFNFKQTINDKNEEGNCIIQYPKKIYCKYNNLKKKLIVSNGNSLVIKNQAGKEYFIYPLEQTPFALILDKNLLLKKIEKLKAKFLNEKYYLFNMENNGNLINIFFDKDTYDLIGWQMEDVYQNLVVTYIFNVKKNSNINKKIFKLPESH
tara:strand:- start:3432 stop:3989 length:558 start_codon:yes stop_codon:yes gene_type:complete